MFTVEKFELLYRDLINIDENTFCDVYDEDVEFIDPITTHHGAKAVREYISNISGIAQSCTFSINAICVCAQSEHGFTHIVNWTMSLIPKNSKSVICVDGTSQLKVRDNKVVFQRDYYDLGEMVYENIPLIGWIVRRIKRKLSA